MYKNRFVFSSHTMPQVNVLGGAGGRVFDPWGNQLEGVVKHHFARQVRRGRSWLMEHSPPGKRQKISDAGYINRPSSATAPPTTMPQPRRASRYPARRRRYRPRRSRRRHVPRPLAPHTKVITGRFVSHVSLTSTTGALTKSNVIMNDVVDPLGSNGTNQFLWFDQAAALYDVAVVLGFKIKVNVHNTTSTGDAIVAFVLPMKENEGTGSYTSYEHVMEVPGAVSQVLTADQDRGSLMRRVSLKKWFGLTNLKDNQAIENDLNTPTSPTQKAYCLVGMQSLDQSTTTTADLIYTVEMIVLLKDRKTPSRSVS